MSGTGHSEESGWREEFASFARTYGITIITPDVVEYETARLLYNRMHDLRPAFIARTLDSTAIAQILRFAQRHSVALAIRGGGHHIAGFGGCDDGIVIDFSTFRNVVVDVQQRTVEVEPGVRLADLDTALAPHRLVVPSGTVSDTGIVGLTLGGGIGWLVGRYGLTCDHLIGADLVLANGDIARAEDDLDLLWALRGGGGNFGVATSLRFQACDLLPFVAGSILIGPERMRQSLYSVVSYMENGCPHALTIAPTLSTGPTGGQLSVDFCLVGEDHRPISELRDATKSNIHFHRSKNFVSWQSAMNHLFEPPMRGYWKSRYSASLTTGNIDTIVEAIASPLNPEARFAVTIEHLHGAFCNEPKGKSAFPLRGAKFGVLIAARWPSPSIDKTSKAWVRSTYDAMDTTGEFAAYSNYSEADDTRCFLGMTTANRNRLSAVKRRYDPFNLFRRNHNVPVAPASTEL